MPQMGKLDATVAVLGASWLIMFFGGAYGWWIDWWHSTSDFRLPILLIATGSSAIAGVVAAATYEWMRERSERRRWRPAEYVGAAQLVGRSLAVAQAVSMVIRNEGGATPTEVESLEDIITVEKAFRADSNLANHQLLAKEFGDFAQEAWEIVRSMPGLRDDPVLVRETAQAADVVRHWLRTLQRVQAGKLPASRAHEAAANVSISIDVGWQVVRTSCEYGSQHLDARIDDQAYDQYAERETRVANAVRKIGHSGVRRTDR